MQTLSDVPDRVVASAKAMVRSPIAKDSSQLEPTVLTSTRTSGVAATPSRSHLFALGLTGRMSRVATRSSDAKTYGRGRCSIRMPEDSRDCLKSSRQPPS